MNDFDEALSELKKDWKTHAIALAKVEFQRGLLLRAFAKTHDHLIQLATDWDGGLIISRDGMNSVRIARNKEALIALRNAITCCELPDD